MISSIRAGISQGNNYGVTEAPITAPPRVLARFDDDDDEFKMLHIGKTGNHSYLNSDDMHEGWNAILLEDQSFDLKVRRTADNFTQISTVGFNMYRIDDADLPRVHLGARNRVYKEAELVMVHNWPTGWGSKSTSGLQSAANGAAGFVANAPVGSYSFCSTVYSPAGLKAQVAFVFYGDYAPENPPPCYSS